MKIVSNIRAWFKRNVFVAPLKPRTVLFFSFASLFFVMLPLLLLWCAFVGILNATYLYGEVVNIPTVDIIGLVVLFLAVVAIIGYSVYRIAGISVSAVKKRKRAKALKK